MVSGNSGIFALWKSGDLYIASKRCSVLEDGNRSLVALLCGISRPSPLHVSFASGAKIRRQKRI